MRNMNKKNIVIVIAMIFLDIFIKILVNIFWMDERLLIADWIGFLPFLNTKQLSIFNSELGWDLDIIYLIAINVVVLAVLIWVRKRVRAEKEWSRAMDIGTLMVLAGGVCSLIDKVFWKGSLDYILLFSKIIDLKDIYMTLGFLICAADIVRQKLCVLFIKIHVFNR